MSLDSSLTSNTSSSVLESDERTCHILPCNIDWQGMASTHVFFRPVKATEGYYSSTFRGRGLTATQDGRTTAKMAILSSHNEKVQVKASVENVLEWHHEHDPETLQCDDGYTSRVSVAQEWSEVGQAVRKTTDLCDFICDLLLTCIAPSLSLFRPKQNSCMTRFRWTTRLFPVPEFAIKKGIS